MHLHVELFCWCSQHPPFGAESALGCSRQDQVSRDGRIKRYLKHRNMRCDVMIWKLEIENWMKLAGYPVYFENELIDYGQFPSVAFRVEKNECPKLRKMRLGTRCPVSPPEVQTVASRGCHPLVSEAVIRCDHFLIHETKCLTNEVWRFTLSAKVPAKSILYCSK